MTDEQFENLISRVLTDEKNKIMPDKNLLADILSTIDTEVTTSADNRFMVGDGSDEIKGRAFVDNEDQIYNSMAINWKLALGVAVLAVIAVFTYFQYMTKPVQYAGKGGEQFSLVPATGKIDDAVSALLKDMDSEKAATAAEEEDISLINIDSQAISSFGQSYNENEF